MTWVAKSILSVAILATSDPFEAFIAERSSAWVSTMTTESNGPKGSAWWSDQDAGGWRTQEGAM